MQIPLIKGRLFDDQDTVDKPHVVLVDEFMAKQLWPNQDPLGKRISFGDLAAKPEWVTVVGVVGRIKQDALDSDSRIALYMPHSQFISRLFNIVLRTSTDPASLTSAVAHELHEVDRDLPIAGKAIEILRFVEGRNRRNKSALGDGRSFRRQRRAQDDDGMSE